MCISGSPQPWPSHAHLAVCTIIPEFYLRDHFLAVSSTPLSSHSSLRNTYIGMGVEDWSFDAVTFFSHRLLTFSPHVTRQNSKVSVSTQVCSSNLTAHPPVHPPIHLVHPSVQPYNICQKREGKASDNDMAAICYSVKMENLLCVTVEIVVKVEVMWSCVI